MKRFISVFVLIAILSFLSQAHASYFFGGAAGGGNPGGTDKQVQFNDAGSFGGAELYYDKTNIRLGVNNSTPAYTLDITGDLNFTGSIYFGGVKTIYFDDTNNNLAIGPGATFEPTRIGQVVIGDGAYSTFNYDVVIGNGAYTAGTPTSDTENVIVGHNTRGINTTNAVLVGPGISAYADDAVIFGLGSTVSNSGAIYSTLIGAYHKSQGPYVTSVGGVTCWNNYGCSTGDTVVGSYSGPTSTGTTTYSAILGYKIQVNGTGNIWIGANPSGATVSGNYNIIIGYDNAPPSATGNNQLDIADTIYGDTLNKRVGINTATLHSTFHTNGSVARKVDTLTASATLANSHVVLCDASGAAVTLTLPDATTVTGREYIIKKIDGTANACDIAAQTGQTIDGVNTVSLTTQYAFRKIISDGSNWYIIGQ